MTKKDSELVAAAIKDLYMDIRQSAEDCTITSDKLFGIRCTAREIADVFAHENPRFNRRAFLEACGISV